MTPARSSVVLLSALLPVIVAARGDIGKLLRSGHAHDLNATSQHVDFGGSKLERAFLVYTNLPVGEKELIAAGWTKHNKQCDPYLGYAWTEDKSGATKSTPTKLYTTKGGQLSGIGVIMMGYGYDSLPDAQKKWATTNPLVAPTPSAELAHIDIAFRSGDIVCSGSTSGDIIGDTLKVNPGGGANNSRLLPLSEAAAKAEGWHRGSCFDGMGWHYFLDTAAGHGQMTWQAANLFPVVTMFHEGKINAVFFASQNDQVSIPIIKANEWEPKSLTDSQMCANTCDADCHFGHTSHEGDWSTMHFYFRDHDSVVCDNSLHCGITFPSRMTCCEKSGEEIASAVLVV